MADAHVFSACLETVASCTLAALRRRATTLRSDAEDEDAAARLTRARRARLERLVLVAARIAVLVRITTAVAALTLDARSVLAVRLEILARLGDCEERTMAT